MKEELLEVLGDAPIIAAVKSDRELNACLACDCRVIFILYGDICSISEIVNVVHQAGKYAFVHMDLIEGLAPREVGVDFIKNQTNADGIISTKSSLIRRAKQEGLMTVQRYFLLDSLVLESIEKQDVSSSADLIEVLPGLMPKIIRHLTAVSHKPIIAGGLIRDKEDVVNALSAGAIAISSTNQEVWLF